MTSANAYWDFPVYSDEDEKLYVPSHSNFTYLFLLDVKEPTPLLEKNRGRRPRWCGHSLRVVGLVRDGTSHATWVPFAYISSGRACVQKSL